MADEILAIHTEAPSLLQRIAWVDEFLNANRETLIRRQKLDQPQSSAPRLSNEQNPGDPTRTTQEQTRDRILDLVRNPQNLSHEERRAAIETLATTDR